MTTFSDKPLRCTKYHIYLHSCENFFVELFRVFVEIKAAKGILDLRVQRLV